MMSCLMDTAYRPFMLLLLPLQRTIWVQEWIIMYRPVIRLVLWRKEEIIKICKFDASFHETAQIFHPHQQTQSK